MNERIEDDNLVLRRVDPIPRWLTAGPHEVVIIVRNGKITVFTEDRKKSFLRGIPKSGRRSDVYCISQAVQTVA